MTDDDLRYLAAYDDELDDLEPDFPECSREPKDCPNIEKWWPELNAPQMELFNDYTRNVLCDSERFSGKSIGVGHKAIRHAWETWDALVLITTYSLEGLTSGLMEDLTNLILPEWEANIGLEHTPPRQNVSKTTFIKVANKFGGWSTIMFKPCPTTTIISTRFKPIKASMIVFEEMGDQNNKAFYTKLNQQLRRNHVKQFQFIAVTNPPEQGPKHYLYEMFFVEPEDPKDAERWKLKYKRIYFPAHLNKWRDVAGYLEDIKFDNRGDSNAVARLVEGKWEELQLGDGIFKDYFIPEIHIKGDLASNRRLVAQPNMPIVLGGDMGDVNNGFSFLQQVHMKDKVVWMMLAELETVGKKLSIPQLMHLLLSKMSGVIQDGATLKGMDISQAVQNFRFDHIADSSTLRFRQSGGDIERELIKKETTKILQEHAAQYPYIKDPIYFKPAPKGDGSVEFRVKMLIEMLQTERFVVDASCVKTIEMFKMITSGKTANGSPFAPGSRSKYKHILDAITYPIVYHTVRGDSIPDSKRIKPKYY